MSREIARAKRTGLPLSLIITDLDHFKKIDAVLSHTVKLYHELLRAEDLPARFGGEEFVVVLPGVNMTDGFFLRAWG
nr:diguanylate cyclase [Desulfobacula sp.]